MSDKTFKIVNGDISDGCHTFDELYEHRITLFIALCKRLQKDFLKETMADSKYVPWRSHLHSDGTLFNGWFILGIGERKGEQITYHLPMDRWEKCGFVETLARAPEYDGHTPEDVLKRLENL
jgi:hypothetical protein